MNRYKLVYIMQIQVLCLILSLFLPRQVYGQTSYIDQKIDYIHKDAGEVYLVWGIDGWKTIPSEFYVDHTFISKGKLLTKMSPADSVFTTSIRIPEGSTLNFMFWVSKNRAGDVTDEWDIPAGRKNRIKPGENRIVVRASESKTKTRPFRALFSSGIILVLLVLSASVFALLKFTRASFSISYTSFILIIASGVYFLHFFLRWRQNGPLEGFSAAMSSTLSDAILIFSVTLIFLLLGVLFRSHHRLLSVCFSAISALIGIAAIANAEIVSKLGQPLNYQWLYYSDFLGSTEAQTAIMANLSMVGMLRNIGMFAGLILLILTGVLAFSLLRKSNSAAWLTASLIVIIPLSGRFIFQEKLNTAQQANPVTYFIGSVWSDVQESNLFTMEVPPSALVNIAKTQPLTGSPVKNVIVLVLESAGAQYFDIYGGKFDITPNLNAAAGDAVIFDRMYAHAPATNKSMVALLCSMYPWISYNTLTQEYPNLNQSSVAGAFSRAGYRTAFLTSSDLGFQNSGNFIKERGFEKVADHRNVSCEKHFKMQGFDKGFGIGVDDMCLGPALFNWVDEMPASGFFSVLWTNQAHYPYFFEGEETDFGVNDIYFNRYLNIIEHYDKLIGLLIDGLKARNMMDSTLIAVVGDHGEAFGQHSQTGHGHNIYEENIHVPMMLINPLLFSGERMEKVSGHIDLPPTLLQLAGLEAPLDWQGTSMFNEEKPNRTFFFTPWSDYLFGGRFGNFKVIFNETTGEIQLYDLSADPAEQKDLTDASPDRIEDFRKEVAAWVQEQQHFIDNKINTAVQPY